MFYKCTVSIVNIILLKYISILIYFARIFIICFFAFDVNLNIRDGQSGALIYFTVCQKILSQKNNFAAK